MWWMSVVIIRAPLPPSGWPSAIAPPLGLSALGSAPISASQASGTGANASLTSNAPISSSRGRSCAAPLSGGNRRRQHDHRVVGGEHGGVHPGDRGQAEFARLLARRHQQRGRAVADLRAVAGGDHAVRLERWLELAELLERRAAADAFIGVHHRAVVQLDRGDLPGEPALVDGSGGLLVRGEGVLVELVRDRPQRSAIISAPMPWFGGTPLKKVSSPDHDGFAVPLDAPSARGSSTRRRPRPPRRTGR